MKRVVVDDPPPFLGSWGRVYAAVGIYLVALIGLFWLFGKAWS